MNGCINQATRQTEDVRSRHFGDAGSRSSASPAEVVSVRYGRLAAYKRIEERELVVVYEKENEEIEVITVLWVDERRLRRLGFTRV
ncbi:MAG: hypothetical protein ACE5L6_02620 [Candidatus Bathyarchaeia archaeon]